MKYMGSKNRHAKELLPIILKDRGSDQWYVEPFVGGANMIDKVDGMRWGNDYHTNLIAMWQALQGGWTPDVEYTKKQYIEAKTGQLPAHITGYIGFNCSYSGKYFGGYAGKTKTKIGTVRDYQLEAFKNVISQMEYLIDVKFTNLSYDEMDIPENSIIYCDPPYAKTTCYQTGEFDHDKFWQWCRDKVGEGHKVFVSEYTAPDDFVLVWEKKASSSLSANGLSGGSKLSVEKLFVYKDRE